MSQSAWSIPAVERVPIDRLPVVHDPASVLADEIRLDLLHRRRDGERPALGHRLAEADDALVGVHLQEQPARFDEQRLEAGDADAALALGLGGSSRLHG
jgi:hypothetical protein